MVFALGLGNMLRFSIVHLRFMAIVVCCLVSGCDDTTRTSETSSASDAKKKKKKKSKKKKKAKNEETKKRRKGEQGGDSDEPSAPNLPPPAPTGKAVTVGTTVVTVSGHTEVEPTAKSEKPGGGEKLIAVSVQVGAAEGGSTMYAGALFDCVDGAAKRYRASILPCTDTPLGSGSLSAGQHKTGDLCFVVPKDAAGLQLMFKSSGKDAQGFTL